MPFFNFEFGDPNPVALQRTVWRLVFIQNFGLRAREYQSSTAPIFIGATGADPGFFLGGGALVSCATSTPINHIVFHFLQNTSCIRKPQVISRGGAHSLHPSPRSAPGITTLKDYRSQAEFLQIELEKAGFEHC